MQHFLSTSSNLASDQTKLSSKKRIYTRKELLSIANGPIPKHIAIIMDGNRRWEIQRHSNFQLQEKKRSGHRTGAETLYYIIQCAQELKINTLTLFAFSTENWNRSQKEVSFLLNLIKEYLKNKQMDMVKEGIRLQVIGDLDLLPFELQDTIKESMQITSSGQFLNLVLAINYGSRNELLRAFKKIYNDISLEKLNIQDINEQIISQYLDTASLSDPDLLIRTSGEMRISNFLLWQIAYTEIYVTKTLWPDFGKKELLTAIRTYQNRERRTGK